MDRRDDATEGAGLKAAIADRLRSRRVELFGEGGIPQLASRLGLPGRTWLNYEDGVTIPGEVLLHFLAITGTNPLWLLGVVGASSRTILDGASLAKDRQSWHTPVRKTSGEVGRG